ncbi:hypothetical protein Tco_1273334 [Tanacetum coccineum]
MLNLVVSYLTTSSSFLLEGNGIDAFGTINRCGDVFGAFRSSSMQRGLCDLDGVGLGDCASHSIIAFKRSYGNLSLLIHLEFEELELDRRELDKQEVEQPESIDLT